MKSYSEAREGALAALQNLAGDDMRHAPGAINPYLEDAPCPARVQQSLEFVSEVFLHGCEGDGDHVVQNFSADALEGLGWILRSCHEALGLLEAMRVQGAPESKVQAVK